MHYAIIADIHANLEAFIAVLEDIEKLNAVEKIWCLGDIVGYGPNPHECIELLQETNFTCVAGNHDRAATGRLNISHFNKDAAEAIQWTEKQLYPSDKKFLDELPETAVEEQFTLVHGSPRDPLNEYIISISTARENFPFFNTGYCLFGHSHEPQIYYIDKDGNYLEKKFSDNIKLVTGGGRLMINPGSTGQPRDGDPRAGYAVYDSESSIMQLRRVPYNIRATQDKMISRGLPISLAGRLEKGN
jgi:predicted phosphodiesterase